MLDATPRLVRHLDGSLQRGQWGLVRVRSAAPRSTPDAWASMEGIRGGSAGKRRRLAAIRARRRR